MRRRRGEAGITLVEVMVIIVVLGIAMAVLLPTMGHHRQPGPVRCANNLSQLWKMENVYMASRGGRMKLFPAETGGQFWLKLNSTTPPLIEDSTLEIFFCPVRGGGAVKGKTDYLGPASDVNEFPEDAFIGGDKPGNHDDYATGSGYVVRKSGDVLELEDTEYDDFVRACRP